MAVPYFQPMTDEDISEVWRSVGKSEASAKEDVEIAREWLNSQPHLPHTLRDKQIKCFLFLAKGSMEKMKRMIDMYFTMRSLYPEIFFDSHPFSKRMLDVSEFVYSLPMPKFDEDIKRILFMKLKDKNPADFDIYASCALLLNIVDVWMLEEFRSDHFVIFDMKHCKLGHLTKLSPVLLRNMYNILGKAFTIRVYAVHLINAPSILDHAVFLLKSILTPKLANRIFVHKDMKSVLNSIDKKFLPRDYGGFEDSLEELEAKFMKKYEEHKDFFDERETWTVNEDLRPSKTTNDEYLGYYGNFKKLDVD